MCTRVCNSYYPPRGRTRPVLEPDRARTRKKRELLVRYSFLFLFLLVRYSCLVVFLLVHGRVKKTRTRPWTSTGQVRLRARTSTVLIFAYLARGVGHMYIRRPARGVVQ